MKINAIENKSYHLAAESSSPEIILKWSFRFLVLWIEILMDEIDFLVHPEKEKCRNNTILGCFKFC
jgi:DNA mismatch repair ATPase MutL